MRKLALLAAANASLTYATAFAGETTSAPGAEVYFINLKNGDTVKGPAKVVFGLSGMGVASAGIDKEKPATITCSSIAAPLGQGEDGADEITYNIPADENHIHFGGGQTETTVELAPGTHTLQLVLADKNHIPHNPPITSEVITITVK